LWATLWAAGQRLAHRKLLRGEGLGCGPRFPPSLESSPVAHKPRGGVCGPRAEAKAEDSGPQTGQSEE
jgi:hypothetical protein